jgi:hypothetical protein
MEFTITSPYVNSRVDSNTVTVLWATYARVDLNPMPESTLFPVRDLDLASVGCNGCRWEGREGEGGGEGGGGEGGGGGMFGG